jgi:SNF2 family DNA or RNA helicase
MIPPPYTHQKETSDFISATPNVFVTSSCGTGKTRSVLDAFAKTNEKMLVFAPLSILKPAWGDDIDKFAPQLSYSIAYSRNRAKAFSQNVDIVITNHDAIKWLKDNPNYISNFSWLVIDESDAFKNKNSQRSKAMAKIAPHFKKRILMTGTPNGNTILDTWHQIYILDKGERLGGYFPFRNAVCAPKQVGPSIQMIKWVDKPGAEEIVADLIKDINIRYTLEECIDIPENVTRRIYVELNNKSRAAYNELADNAILELSHGTVSALHAGTLTQKLAQLAAGSVYDEDGEAQIVHKDRYELIIELVRERKHTVVFYNWTHQRDILKLLADKAKLTHASIYGGMTENQRNNAVSDFQSGKLSVIFCQVQAAAHGLTLTKGATTIFTSALYNASYAKQAMHRIYRAGQTKKTETLFICAKDTIEEHIYTQLESKTGKLDNLLDLLNRL